MVLTTPASSAQDPKPITPGSRTGPYFPKAASNPSKRPGTGRDSTPGRATGTAPPETPRVPPRPSVSRKLVPRRRSSTVPENQEPVPTISAPIEQPKPLILRKTLPWLRRSTLDPTKSSQDANDTSTAAAVASTKAPTDAVPGTLNGRADDQPDKAHESSPSASRTIPTTDQTPNGTLPRDTTQPNPTSPPSNQSKPLRDPKDLNETPAPPPSSNPRPATDNHVSQASAPPSRDHRNDPRNAPPAVPPVHDRLSDPEYPRTLPVGTFPAEKALDAPPPGAVAEPRVSAPGSGAPKVALEPAAEFDKSGWVGEGASRSEREASGQVPVEFPREVGREARQEEGEGVGAFRSRQGGKSGVGKEFESVAERAVPKVEDVAGEFGDEDGIVAEKVQPESLGYWKPRRVRSPMSFWTETTQALKGMEKAAEKVAEPLEDAFEGIEHSLVEPSKIEYWKPQRVRDPTSFWAAAEKGLKEVGQEIEKVVEPLEDIVEDNEHALVEPAKIEYWKPRRVRSPMSFWTETTQALKTTEKVAEKVAEPLEDIVEGIEHALVEPAKIGYWQPKKVADPAFYLPKVLEPIQNLPHVFGHAHKVQSQSEDSFSEYSGGISNYHYRSSSCGTYDSSRKSLSSGSRQPDFVPTKTLPISHLWNARHRRGSQYSTADLQDIRQASKQLDHAFRGLNVLMEEAMAVAQQAAHSGHPDEVAVLFNNAKATLKQATTIREVALGRFSENEG